MDRQLSDRLQAIAKQIEVLRGAEEAFLNLDASKKTLLAQLFLGAEGSSVMEREMKAHAHPTWVQFMKGLAESETVYNREKRRLELMFKAYDAAHLSFKIENQSITKGVE